MIVFTTALVSVGIMLLYCLPGFVLMKTGAVKEEHIAPFSKLLLYVLQTVMVVDLFIGKDHSKETLINIGWFALAVFIMLAGFLTVFWLIFRKKMKTDSKYRIFTVASCLCNCGFMGVPLLRALLPGTDAALYSAVFSVVMNMLSWTLALFIMTGDTAYVKTKKLIFNPLTFSLTVALPLFFTGYVPPTELREAIALLSKMTTPVSMIIIGMRLATVKFKELFCDVNVYIIMAVKLIIFPLVWVALSFLFPMPVWLKQTMLIMCACPCASIILNFSEFVGKGQKTAVNVVLLSTLSTIITLPVLVWIFA